MTKESWGVDFVQQQPGLDRARQQGRSSRLPGLIGCPISPSSLLPSSPILTLGTCPLQRHTQQTREPTRPLRLGCSPQQIFSTSTPLPSRGTGQLGAQYPTTDMRHGPNETHGNRQHDLVSSRWADCHVSFRSMIPLRASSPPPRLVPSAVGSPSSGPWPMAEGRCNGLMLALPSPEDHRPVGLRSPQHMEQREVSDKSEVELPERFLLCSRISIRHRRPEGAGRERRQDNLTATTTTATMTPTEPTGRFPAVQHHDAACLAARHGSVSQIIECWRGLRLFLPCLLPRSVPSVHTPRLLSVRWAGLNRVVGWAGRPLGATMRGPPQESRLGLLPRTRPGVQQQDISFSFPSEGSSLGASGDQATQRRHVETHDDEDMRGGRGRPAQRSTRQR